MNNVQSLRPQYAAGTAPLYADDAPMPLVFLPAAGYRDYNTGEVLGVGTIGNYWSGNGFAPTTTSYNMNFTNTKVDAGANSARAHGYSVRCVRIVPDGI